MCSDYLDFLLIMTEKEIKTRYKNAILGFLWILINPVLQMIIIGLIFQYFIKIPIKNFFLFLFTGLLPWNFFSYSITKTAPSIVFERDLIQKAKFPREAIPLSIVFSNFFHFFISILLLFVFLLVLGGFHFLYPIKLLLLLVSLVWLLMITSGLSLLFSSLNVRYRDINFFVQALSLLWFYATPVIYPLEALPKQFILLLSLNPLVYPIQLFRSSFVTIALPSPGLLISNLLISILLLTWGIIEFKKQAPYFSDWL